MLIVVGVVFLFLNTPRDIYYLEYSYGHLPLNTDKRRDDSAIFFAVAILLCFTNSAINFLLYLVSGAKFRKALRATLCIDVIVAKLSRLVGQKKNEKRTNVKGVEKSHSSDVTTDTHRTFTNETAFTEATEA